ncbi:L-rhamnose isomerase/sugar isomerase [Silvibacterium bohemicum]|uniref:L-rhamnose isomerase/sugar isomerase n=1 Tax=Silvibacterium bohemicum TaxID=1577686 RepID=A0A841K500_9BACT|nr:L-rhamnose isomerase/sugar isomerase [Silvibacterium bohemicum]
MNNHSGSAHGDTERVFQALDSFRIELPSWGFSNTGTRFGKFVQPAAATNLEEKFADAGQVNALTGASPTVALHVLWDTPNGVKDAAEVRSLETKYGVRAGSINPNLFQDQKYKFGSLANPSAEIRQQAVAHCIESVEVAKALDSRDISMWISDGANYPGSQSIRRRIDWLQESLKTIHDALRPDQRMLVEYKPFEPAFYFTDVADWGMALEYARSAGPQAKVLVDTGHHYQAQNVEQIVAWLLHLKALGGFHFNDRKYADDDLTLGSIDPYQVFRIFYEIVSGAGDQLNDIAFMIDQSHNLKGKVEAMVQTVVAAQELYAKAALVDQAKLAGLQDECRLVEAEELFRGAFYTDVRPAVAQWRVTRGLPHDPLKTLYESGYVERAAKQRAAKNAGSVSSYA